MLAKATPSNRSEQIQLTLVEEHGLGRFDQPCRLGIPLPKGFLYEGASLNLDSSDGDPILLQTRPLELWKDRSIKWLLLDFLASVPANSHTVLTLSLAETSEHVHQNLKVESNKDLLTVDTGQAVFSLHQNEDILFHSINVAGNELLALKGSSVSLLGKHNQACGIEMHGWQIEEHGPVQCTLFGHGKFFPSRKKKHLNFSVRHRLYKDLARVRTEFILHNPAAAIHPGGLWDLGDPGSFLFKELSLRYCLSGGCTSHQWQLEPGTAPFSSEEPLLTLYQDSSGGEQWDSPNHVDCFGKMTTRFKGYRVLKGSFESDNLTREGLRASPWLVLHNQQNSLGASIEHFWQNFPKGLQVKEGQLSVLLFPSQDGQHYELQGGEQKRHCIHWQFGESRGPTPLSATHHPLNIRVDPNWVENSKAIACFIPQQKDQNEKYLKYVATCIDGKDSFFNKREQIDEYGWRNFGDTYADHEAVNHKGNEPFISHYNNQYDFVYGALNHFLRSGNSRWMELAEPAAWHMIDIDIYRTQHDKAAYNHGQFWHTDHYRQAHTATHRAYSRKSLDELDTRNYGGGCSNENNYTSGLLLYHLLTGDPEARKTVLGLANYVIDMDNGGKTILGLIDEGPTGLASQTVSTDFHKPGRGAGNSINTLIDAYRLEGNRKYLQKAEELIQRVIHPKDEIEDLQLIKDPEYRWSYLVFLQILGKYLDYKEELAELDYGYFFARDSLLHYASWMVDNEVPYKTVLDRVEIPTETWPAQDIRKSCVFYYAAKYCQPADMSVYLERGEFFYHQTLEDLHSFETAYLTRPQVLLTVYGTIHAFFQEYKSNSKVFMQHNYNFGEPVEFVPQKSRLKGVLKQKGRVLRSFTTRLLAEKTSGLKSRIT